jgi:hypothetical protein
MPSRVTQTCTEVLASVDTQVVPTLACVTQIAVEVLGAAPALAPRRYVTALYHKPRAPRAAEVRGPSPQAALIGTVLRRR